MLIYLPKFEFLIIGENFPEEGFLLFSIVWGKERAKIKEIPSQSKMAIYQEAAFKVIKNDQRIIKQEQLYLKCIHTSPAGVKRHIGIADVLLDPNVQSVKKVTKFFVILLSFNCFKAFYKLLFFSGTNLPIN